MNSLLPLTHNETLLNQKQARFKSHNDTKINNIVYDERAKRLAYLTIPPNLQYGTHRNIFDRENARFSLSNRYSVVNVLGKGSYGVVCSAKEVSNDRGYLLAIKKITNIFDREVLLKRAIRELKFMNFFQGHKNIVNLIDIELIFDKPYDGLYCYQELIDYDLAKVIHSSVQITEFHIKYFVYQILCGLKYIHSADVIHRDLKPGNILCTLTGCLKICDFGLARGISNKEPYITKLQQQDITNYVATRWYRAPEIILSRKPYSKAIDIWSLGCILGEFYGRKPIFMGNDSMHQVYQIIRILGFPSNDLLIQFGSVKAWNLINNSTMNCLETREWQSILPEISQSATDLLDKFLQWEPSARITVEEALEHEFIQSVRKINDEPNCSHGIFDFSYESSLKSMNGLREYLINEIITFKRQRK